MAQIGNISGWIHAINTADGAKVTPDSDGWVTLATGTYVFVLRVTDQPLESININTDGTIAWSGLTVEDTNAPRDDGDAGTRPGSITDWTVTSGNPWTQEDPSTAYVGRTGSGWTITNLTLVKTAAVGSAMLHLGNLGSARVRIKVVVTTAGTMRVAPHGKS